MKYTNPKYSGGYPVAVGDLHYSQDLFRDLRYNQSQVGKLLKRLFGGEKVIIDGLVCSQGAGHTLNVTLGQAIGNFEITKPHESNAWANPPDTDTEDIIVLIPVDANIVNEAITSAVTDGVTTNYVKLAYNEVDGNTRARQYKAGTYAYEVAPGYVLTVDDTAPTTYEVLLDTFTSDGATITFTGGGDTRIDFDLTNYNQNIREYNIKAGESLAYGDWVHTNDQDELLITNDTYEPSIVRNPANSTVSAKQEMVILDNDYIACIYTENSIAGMNFTIYDKDGNIILAPVLMANSYFLSPFDHACRIFNISPNRILITYFDTTAYLVYYAVYDYNGSVIKSPAAISVGGTPDAYYAEIKAGAFQDGSGDFWITYATATGRIIETFNNMGVSVNSATVHNTAPPQREVGTSSFEDDKAIIIYTLGTNTQLYVEIFDKNATQIASGQYEMNGTLLNPGKLSVPFVGFSDMIQYKDHFVVLASTEHVDEDANADQQRHIEKYIFRLKPFLTSDLRYNFVVSDYKRLAHEADRTAVESASFRFQLLIPMQDGIRCFVNGKTVNPIPLGIFNMETFNFEEILARYRSTEMPYSFGQLTDGSIVYLYQDNLSHIIVLRINRRNYLCGMVEKVMADKAKVNIGQIVKTNRTDLVKRKGYYADDNGELTDVSYLKYKRIGWALDNNVIFRDTFPYGGGMGSHGQ